VKKNVAVRRTVDGTTYGAMDKAVFWAVGRAVYRAVDGAVGRAVYRAVDRAANLTVNRAVYWVLDDPPHLALRDFLSGYADQGAP
jgi:hypothetical protein